MALSLNKPKLDNLANDIWKSAERCAASSILRIPERHPADHRHPPPGMRAD
jgi:hypothetical protein